jgi:hypothetical protein
LTQSGLSLLDETAFLDKLSSYRERAWDTLREFLPGPDQERFLYGLVWQQLELAGKGLRPARFVWQRARPLAAARKTPSTRRQH